MMMHDAGLSESLCFFSKMFPKTLPDSLRIYKVALALGDYLKVRAHACIGGRTLKTRFLCNTELTDASDSDDTLHARVWPLRVQQETQGWTVWEDNFHIL